MDAVSKIYLKFRYYFQLSGLNLDLKSVSEDACLSCSTTEFRCTKKLLCPGTARGLPPAY